jgi:hypothetical protein
MLVHDTGGQRTGPAPRMESKTRSFRFGRGFRHLGIAPMFQYATCDDLIQLKARYPEYCFPERDGSYCPFY